MAAQTVSGTKTSTEVTERRTTEKERNSRFTHNETGVHCRSTNTWPVPVSVLRAFYFAAFLQFDNKESRRTFAIGRSVKRLGSNGTRTEIERMRERESEEGKVVIGASEKVGSKRGGICGGNHHLTDPARSFILSLCTCKRCTPAGGRVKCS